MSTMRSKTDAHLLSSDGDAAPSSRDRSRSLVLHFDGADRVDPPIQHPDLDEQVVHLVQQKMQELLPSTSDLGRRRKGRRPQQSDESYWEDLSADPQSSDDDMEQEVFIAHWKRTHKKKPVDSSDGDAYTRAHKKEPLVKKKKSKKTKKQKALFSNSSSDSSTSTSKSDTPLEGKYAKICNKTTKKCKVTKRK